MDRNKYIADRGRRTLKKELSVPWWREAVIYLIYPFSFYDSNDDGIGDLAGIIQKLNYLNSAHNSLGVDAVWITPVFASPWADYGYDVSDYARIDPLFGNVATAERLIRECHKRNIRVIFDFVPNHTSNEHPWFVQSKSSRDNPKQNFYIWADPNPDGGPPSRHQSVFGGSAWEFSHRRGQYYFHYFYKEQPDLNWLNPNVRREMKTAIEFWLKKGVDGFRFDAVKHLFDKFLGTSKQPCPVRTLTPHDAHEIFREWRALLDKYEAVAIGEAWETDASKWKSYYGANLDEFHLPLNFFFMDTEWSASNIRLLVDRAEANLPKGAWINWSVGNHDISRFISRYGKQYARICAMLLTTLRGTPILYYGDEIGMTDVPVPSHKTRDRFGRDKARTPMQWDKSANAGFTSGMPWLPVGDFSSANVVSQSNDPASLLTLYKQLIHLRRENPALRLGEYQSFDTASNQCFGYLRTIEEEKIIVILNFSGKRQKPGGCAYGDRGAILISTALDKDGDILLKDLVLRPYEGCIVKLS